MKTILFAVLVLIITGCDNTTNRALEKEKADNRYRFFNECLELAAKIERKGDDDVSDIISECSSQAYYMALQFSKGSDALMVGGE